MGKRGEFVLAGADLRHRRPGRPERGASLAVAPGIAGVGGHQSPVMVAELRLGRPSQTFGEWGAPGT
jgi:hypothetical protein